MYLLALQVILGVTVLLVVRSAYRSMLRQKALSHIPTVGSSNWAGSFFSYFWHLVYAREYFDECYYKYPDGVCKIAGLTGWTAVVNGRLAEELVHLDDTYVSLGAAIHQLVQGDLTLGPTALLQPWHLAPIHRLSTSSFLENMYPSIIDETQNALEDYLDVNPGKEWTPVLAYPAMLHVIARVVNRVMSGIDLCHNDDYLRICVDYPAEIHRMAVILNTVPPFARGLTSRLLSRVEGLLSKAASHLQPAIEERKTLRDSAPDDLLTWLVHAAPMNERSSSAIARRYLTVIFAALFTTVQILTHTLYHIAANPEYADRLREEARSVTKEFGWSYDAIQSLPSFDSILRETGRYTGIAYVGLQRKAVKSFTLSDGTYIPEGTMINVPSAANHDPALYGHADTFNPWRFCDGEAERDPVTRISSGFWLFGRGRHACPGRFLAALEIKTILARMLLTYDIKTVAGRRPSDKIFVYEILPDPHAQLLLRRRMDEQLH